ncbi:MAG TPA: phage Gp37/Gp68 family protein [Planctomycetota bacterium]|jgi:protein gp37|nr:phage Gp37/Gp68 family protein [Planctomycetota bacterium]
MAGATTIEWTEMTWNPATGCSKMSAGCKNCYAERLARRLQAMGSSRYREGFRLTLHEDLLDAPFRWTRPRRIFVNSMSDLFHEEIPLEFIRRVFGTMARSRQHTFQILTKRSRRLRDLAHDLPWPANVWMGVSVEDARAAARVHDLRLVPAAVRFLSCEPLLGPIENLPLDGIHWVIVGGESGPGARPIRAEWVDSIYDQCRAAGVPFFFKQWGGRWKSRTGRVFRGRTYDEMPVRARLDEVRPPAVAVEAEARTLA